MKQKFICLLIAFITLGIAAGCSTSSTKSESVTGDCKEAKAEFLSKDTSLKPILDKAAGYVILPGVAKGALGVGAATGKGQLFVKGKDEPVGSAAMTQVTIGFQAGGQVYHEMILFEDQASLDNFRKGNFEFSAQATAVAVTAGAAATAKYEKGVMVLTVSEKGLMYEASVGGQKFSYTPF